MEEKLIREALRMLREREDYWYNQVALLTNEDSGRAVFAANSYHSAADILEYAIVGDAARLANFDYYGRDA